MCCSRISHYQSTARRSCREIAIGDNKSMNGDEWKWKRTWSDDLDLAGSPRRWRGDKHTGTSTSQHYSIDNYRLCSINHDRGMNISRFDQINLCCGLTCMLMPAAPAAPSPASPKRAFLATSSPFSTSAPADHPILPQTRISTRPSDATNSSARLPTAFYVLIIRQNLLSTLAPQLLRQLCTREACQNGDFAD